MRKIGIFLVFILLISSGCSIIPKSKKSAESRQKKISLSNYRTRLLDSRDDDKIGDTRFQNIIKAIEKKDKEGLKKMFSPNALKKAEDIDGGIDYLMNFYKGKILSKDGAVQTSDSNDHGVKTSELDCMYIVSTDAGKYIVFFIDNIVDTGDTDNVGLYMLQIIRESDREKEFDWGGDKTKCAGIYRPKT